jgi:hypothetical protein
MELIMNKKNELLDKIKGTISKIDVALDGGSILSDVTENLDGSGIVKKESNLKIGDAIEMALSAESNTDKGKRQAMKVKAAKKRKDMVEAKRSLGMVGNKKQSKFSTRSDHFLGDKLEAVQIILNNKQTGIYNDGADFCPRLLMGHPAYGNACKKNAFEHLVNLQKKICEFKGDNPKEAPDWIILCNDTSLIADRNLIPRLKELLPTTGAAAAYGFEKIRASGRWYEMTEQDQSFVRGCYIQANTTDTNWDFIVGNQFKQSPRYRIFIAHGPFIAVRGELFMTIDFKDCVDRYDGGFYHYMAEISMECAKRGLGIASLKTNATQYDNLMTYRGEEQFEKDQLLFTSRWQNMLPNAIPSRLVK